MPSFLEGEFAICSSVR